MSNIEKAVIIHFGRVGSTILSQMLNQNSEIISAGEIYNDKVNKMSELQGKPWYEIYDNYLDFLDIYYQQSVQKIGSNNYRYYIFEYKPYTEGCEINTESIFNNFNKEKGINKFIFLYRKNYLRRLVSVMISFKTQVWHINKKQKITDQINQVYIDINQVKDGDIGIINKSLLETLESYYEYINYIKKYIDFQQGLCLSFEDDIASNPYKGYRKVCDFLNVKPLSNPEINLKRQNPSSLKEIITNFKEVEDYLKNTNFSPLLED